MPFWKLLATTRHCRADFHDKPSLAKLRPITTLAQGLRTGPWKYDLIPYQKLQFGHQPAFSQPGPFGHQKKYIAASILHLASPMPRVLSFHFLKNSPTTVILMQLFFFQLRPATLKIGSKLLRIITWWFKNQVDTLPETNVAPENRPSQKEISIPTIHFQVLLLLVSGSAIKHWSKHCYRCCFSQLAFSKDPCTATLTVLAKTWEV